MQVPDLNLRACEPDPLLSYLKAGGVLRLVGEQADREARGYWEEGIFRLRSCLDAGRLVQFFLEDYHPTPIVSPWNGRSGFYEKGQPTAVKAVKTIANSTSVRLEPYRQAISACHAVLRHLGVRKKPEPSEKLRLLAACRARLPDACLPWLDAAVALADKPRYAPVLGTGGNDGSMDFSSNFMQRLVDVLHDLGANRTWSESWIRAALFEPVSVSLVKAKVGQYHPGGVGGPNATQGFEADSLVNPWDYILALEGVLLFAGGVARRMATGATAFTAFPFTVQAVPAGHGTEADPDYSRGRARGEVWVPLWSRAATVREVRHLLRGPCPVGTAAEPKRGGLR